MIRVADLSVTFGHGGDQVRAVRGISFQVAEGESFGLVGESGSGKSTVLRALAGLNPDWQGRIEVAGAAQAARRGKAFHKLVQMVFQDPYGSLHPRHTVDRILAEPVAIHGLGGAEGRPSAIRSASTGYSLSIGTNMLPGKFTPSAAASLTSSEPIPTSRSSLLIRAAPAKFSKGGAVNMACSSRYSQYPA